MRNFPCWNRRFNWFGCPTERRPEISVNKSVTSAVSSLTEAFLKCLILTGISVGDFIFELETSSSDWVVIRLTILWTDWFFWFLWESFRCRLKELWIRSFDFTFWLIFIYITYKLFKYKHLPQIIHWLTNLFGFEISDWSNVLGTTVTSS